MSFQKLRLQLGWVGSQQNANQRKLRIRTYVGPFKNVLICYVMIRFSGPKYHNIDE